VKATDHKMRKESGTKGETWQQCKECGAAYHGGFRLWATFGEKVEF
jgi:hypothetical protein